MLKLTNLRKTFGDLVAVDDLTLEIGDGEIFGLLGPNGAGKTTTVSMAVGLLLPDSGHVDVNGEGSPTGPAVRRNIGVAPQSLALYEELSGEENLRFFGRLHGLKGGVLAERTAWALEFVDLTDRRKDRVVGYSGGMQRRLNLAVALMGDPKLLLLDEPTVGVDPQSRNAIFDNIEALQAEGCTVVYTTHYMEEAQRLCDRVAIMDRGKLLALGTVQGLIATHGGKSVVNAKLTDREVRIDTDDPVAELAKLNRDGQLLHLTVDGPDLESVFLHLTGRHLRD